METTTADVEKEQVEREPLDEVPIISAVRKYIYVLPSGRRLKIVVDDERELAGVLLVLQS
jgi:hypothetical protein